MGQRLPPYSGDEAVQRGNICTKSAQALGKGGADKIQPTCNESGFKLEKREIYGRAKQVDCKSIMLGGK